MILFLARKAYVFLKADIMTPPIILNFSLTQTQILNKNMYSDCKVLIKNHVVDLLWIIWAYWDCQVLEY